MRLGVIDYGVGNISNVLRCLQHISQDSSIERIFHAEDVSKCDKLILPGVGAFAAALENLKIKNLDNAIIEFAKSGKYLLGICLGMQLLFEKSYEFGEHEGLGLIAGEVVKFGKESSLGTHIQFEDSKDNHKNSCCIDSMDSIESMESIKSIKHIESKIPHSPFSPNNIHALKIPHIGWNKNFQTQQHAITKNMPQEFYLYFVHSYHAVCESKNIVATCEYGVSFPSIVCQENVLGIQPHPERSHAVGFEIMQNFLDL